MPTAVVIATRAGYHLVQLPSGDRRSFPAALPGRSLLEPTDATPLPRSLVAAVEEAPLGTPTRAASPALAAALTTATRRPVGVATLRDHRTARRYVPWPDTPAEREAFRSRAEEELAAALRSPGEILVTLAREEERVERALGREERAAEALLALPGTPLAEYAASGRRSREALARHHDELLATLTGVAESVAPNLTRTVGARVAGRLVAAAGGLPALARMPSARLQLLGARRRPSADRGPRYGLLFRADRMDEVPTGRRGAYARSLAALAAIAARADASSRRDLGDFLLARRDRRVADLRRRRR